VPGFDLQHVVRSEEWVKLGKGKIKTIRLFQATLPFDTKLYFKV
jgi:hypothetical protein